MSAVLMFRRFPSDYPEQSKRGQIASRERTCKKGHVFTQMALNPEWLAGLSDSSRARQVQGAELTEKGTYWIPNLCHACEGRIS